MWATRAASAPNLASAEAALDFVIGAIEKAGFKPGQDVFIGLDCAATEFFKNGAYHYEGEGKVREFEAQVQYLASLVNAYPSSPSRTACPKMTGPGKLLTTPSAPSASSWATTCSSPTSRASRAASRTTGTPSS